MTDKAALLVIDVQNSFHQTPYWDESEVPKFSSKLNQLIGHARRQNWPVIHVFHESKGPFDPESGLVESMAFVDRQDEDPIFRKHVHNALTDSGLLAWLKEEDIQQLLVSGIRTEQCCETTTRVASDLGFKVDFVSEATLTFAMTHPVSGRQFSSQEIREKTELVLVDRFARITSVSDYAVTS